MHEVVAVLNSKGGVGKTTVTLGLASAAQAAGMTTLVVDLDPQANATWALRPDHIERDRTIGDVLVEGRRGAAADAVHPTGWGLEVDVIPADGRLVEREADRPRRDPHLRLREALDGVTADYDLVLVDCAPSLGRVTTWGLAAADTSLIVTEPSALAARGIDAVEDHLSRLSTELERDLPVAGVVVNKVPGRGAEAVRQLERIRAGLGARALWDPPVPQRVVLAEAINDGTPIHWWGARAAEPIEVFDALLARLRRHLARR